MPSRVSLSLDAAGLSRIEGVVSGGTGLESRREMAGAPVVVVVVAGKSPAQQRAPLSSRTSSLDILRPRAFLVERSRRMTQRRNGSSRRWLLLTDGESRTRERVRRG